MPKHKPDEVALIMDISGECTKCKHRGTARLVAYYDRSVIIRCNTCNTVGFFAPDDTIYNDPRKFLPFIDDEEPPDLSSGSGRHTRGPR